MYFVYIKVNSDCETGPVMIVGCCHMQLRSQEAGKNNSSCVLDYIKKLRNIVHFCDIIVINLALFKILS